MLIHMLLVSVDIFDLLFTRGGLSLIALFNLNFGFGFGVDSAVGAHLAAYSFTLKTKPTSPFDPRLEEPLQEKLKFEPLEKSKEWDEGVQYASAQNLARTVC